MSESLYFADKNKYRPIIMRGGNKIAKELIKDIKDDVLEEIEISNINNTISSIIILINDVDKKNDKIEYIIKGIQDENFVQKQHVNLIEKLYREVDVELYDIEKCETKIEKLVRKIVKKIGDANIEPLVKVMGSGVTSEIIPAFDVYVNECIFQYKINMDSIKKSVKENIGKLHPEDIMATLNLIQEMTYNHKIFLEVLEIKRKKIEELIETFSDRNLTIPFSARQDIEYILTDSFIPAIVQIVRSTILISGLSYAILKYYHNPGSWLMFQNHLITTIWISDPMGNLIHDNLRDRFLRSKYKGGSKISYK